MATASAKADRTARDYVDWLNGLGVDAKALDVTENNIERCNRDGEFLDRIGRLGTIVFPGGNQRRLTKVLTLRGEITGVLEHLIKAIDSGTNLVAVGGAAVDREVALEILKKIPNAN